MAGNEMSDTPPTVIGQLKAKLTDMTAERDALLVERNHLHRLALELENMSKGK